MSNSNYKALNSGIWYTVANFITKSIGIITVPIFTRLLTKEQFGEFNNYTSWITILTILVTLYMESTFTRARYDFGEKYDEYILSVLSLSSISAIIWLILTNVFHKYSSDVFGMSNMYINSMLVYLFFLPAINMFQARERIYFKYKSSVFLGIVLAVGTAILSVVCVITFSDKLLGRVIGFLMPTVLIGAVLYIFFIVKGKRIRITYWKYALKICIPCIPHLLSLSVLNSMDKVMISDICGAEANSLYSLAYSCGLLISILLTSLNGAFAPWLGERIACNEEHIVYSFSKKYILIFMFLSVGIMLISPEILLLIGGNSYYESIYVMPPIAFGCACQFLYTMYVNVEQFNKKTVAMSFASVLVAIINYVLNLIFIPRYGYIAAAYTTLIGYVCLLFSHMIIVKAYKFTGIYDDSFVLKTLIVMIGVTVGVNYLYNNLIIRYIIVLIYVIMLAFIFWKNKDVIKGFICKKI